MLQKMVDHRDVRTYVRINLDDIEHNGAIARELFSEQQIAGVVGVERL